MRWRDIKQVRVNFWASKIDGIQAGWGYLANWPYFIQSFIKISSRLRKSSFGFEGAEERGLKGDEAVQAAFEENVAAGN